MICVGGLTLGGTGKTPVVREVLERLAARGVAAHALSRGYGGRLKGPLRVDPAIHAARDVGDEPLMLARDHLVWIAADRVAGAKAAVAAGARALVMDDGHQNPSLEKALSLVVVDGETRDGEWPFGDGDVFPAGPMREPLAAGLARADAVVVVLPNDVAAPDAALLALFGDTPVLVARLEPLGAPPPGPQLGFAGVGKPWKVERALTAAGCDLVDFIPMPDHADLSAGGHERARRPRRQARRRPHRHRKGLGPPARPPGATASRPGPSARGSRTPPRWIACWRGGPDRSLSGPCTDEERPSRCPWSPIEVRAVRAIQIPDDARQTSSCRPRPTRTTRGSRRRPGSASCRCCRSGGIVQPRRTRRWS